MNKVDNFLFKILKFSDTQFTKYTHWKLMELSNWGVQVLLSLYIVSTIYNTIMNRKLFDSIALNDWSINPLMYQNPILWHLNTGFHHVWDLLALLIFFFIMIYAYKMKPIISLYCLTFIVALHEEIWYVVYPFTHIHWEYVWTLIFTPVQLGYAIAIISYLYLSYKKNLLPRPNIFIISMIISYTVWTIVGFPITVDFQGLTEYWPSISINSLEILVWMIAISSYWIDIKVERIKER